MDQELKRRTKAFAVRVVKMTEALPNKRTADIIARQVIRSATSVGANYRAACRARSHREFTARIGVVEEEADETQLAGTFYPIYNLSRTGLCLQKIPSRGHTPSSSAAARRD